MTGSKLQMMRILMDAARLLKKYEDKDLEHNAHGIFQFAFDAARELAWRYDNPLAYSLAQSMVEDCIDRFNAVHQDCA